jgi:hypothetical protein
MMAKTAGRKSRWFPMRLVVEVSTAPASVFDPISGLAVVSDRDAIPGSIFRDVSWLC